jgi:hypothetical protein
MVSGEDGVVLWSYELFLLVKLPDKLCGWQSSSSGPLS